MACFSRNGLRKGAERPLKRLEVKLLGAVGRGATQACRAQGMGRRRPPRGVGQLEVMDATGVTPHVYGGKYVYNAYDR